MIDWRSEAACLGLPTSIFFDAAHRYEDARPVCKSCLVSAQCLKAAIEEEALDGADSTEMSMSARVIYGFRGGLTPKQRRPMVADFLRSVKRMHPNDGAWRRPAHPASCHPEKNRYRRGLCQRCYVRILAKEHAHV